MIKMINKTIMLVRPRETATELINLLSKRGFRCFNIPVVEIESLVDVRELEEKLNEGLDYAVFTSQISVEMLENSLKKGRFWEKFVSILKGARVYSIGPKTKEALEKRGVKVQRVPKRYCTLGLEEILGSVKLKDMKVALFRSADADRELEDKLRAKGAIVLAFYTHKVRITDKIGFAVKILTKNKVDALVLTSSRIVKLIEGKLREDNSSLSEISKRITLVSIGPRTSRTLRELNVENFIEAEEYSSKGICEAILKLFGRNRDV